jgi:hypothetical protein
LANLYGQTAFEVILLLKTLLNNAWRQATYAVTLTCCIQALPEQIWDWFVKVMVKCTIIIITSNTFTNPESFILKHGAFIFATT